MFLLSDLISPLSAHVIQGIKQEYGHHRTEWFTKFLQNINHFFTVHCQSVVDPIFLTSNKNGAFEGLISAAIGHNDQVLSAQEDDFSRFLSNTSCHIDRYTDIESMNKLLLHKKYTIVFLSKDICNQAVENIAEIIDQIKQSSPSTIVLCDLSYGFASSYYDLSLLSKADAYIISPEYALGSISGTVLLFINNPENFPCTENYPSFTYDIALALKAWTNKKTTPYSPNIFSVISLSYTIDVLKNLPGGITSHVQQQQATATFVRNCLYHIFPDQHIFEHGHSHSFVTCDTHEDAIALQAYLGEHAMYASVINSASDWKIRIGHFGYVPKEHLDVVQHILLAYTNTDLKQLHQHTDNIFSSDDYVVAKDTCLASSLFTIDVEEFQAASISKFAKISDKQLKDKLTTSVQRIFKFDQTQISQYLLERHIGFIGAGNTVRETIFILQKMGIKDITIYSPTLLNTKETAKPNQKPHKYPDFWTEKNIKIASSAEEVFMNCETVVLLPTYYTKPSSEIMKKDPEYINDHLVNKQLLANVRHHGKMDTLINASARYNLIDRQALKEAVDDGWLRFFSDELPSEIQEYTDPLQYHENVTFTGHIGGSCKSTKMKIAHNTNKIIKHVLSKVYSNVELQNDLHYVPNCVNQHVAPDVWKYEKTFHSPPQTLRVLLTDKFEINILDIEGLAQEFDIKIEIKDISLDSMSEKHLIDTCTNFDPHIILFRTRTVISDAVANAFQSLSLLFLIRPGVGIDNIYPGMAEISRQGIQIYNEPTGNSLAVGEMTTYFIVNSEPSLLLAPGPTNYCPEIFSSIDQYTDPRDPSYVDTYASVKAQLSSWTTQELPAIIKSAPSTAFLESTVTNAVSNEEIGLVISNGKFGNRFHEICTLHKKQHYFIDIDNEDWGQPHTVEKICKYIHEKNATSKQPISFMCLQQNETSTAISYKPHHLKQIIDALRSHEPHCIVIIDAVSGFFAHDVPQKELDIDALIIGSQKALGLSSGISFLSLSERYVEKLLSLTKSNISLQDFLRLEPQKVKEIYHILGKRQKVFYTNILKDFYESYHNLQPDSGGVFHTLSAKKSLDILAKKNKTEHHESRKQYASAVRKKLHELGFTKIVPEAYASYSVTAAHVPPGLSAPKLISTLRNRFGISIAGSQIPLFRETMIRIGHFGHISQYDIGYLLRSLDRAVAIEKRTRSPES